MVKTFFKSENQKLLLEENKYVNFQNFRRLTKAVLRKYCDF